MKTTTVRISQYAYDYLIGEAKPIIDTINSVLDRKIKELDALEQAVAELLDTTAWDARIPKHYVVPEAKLEKLRALMKGDKREHSDRK